MHVQVERHRLCFRSAPMRRTLERRPSIDCIQLDSIREEDEQQ